MKKAVALLLALIMSFTLFACKNSGDDSTSKSNATQPVNGTTGSGDKTTGAANDETTSGNEGVTLAEPEPMPTGKKVVKDTNDEGMPIGADYLESLRKTLAGNKYTISLAMNLDLDGAILYIPATICKSGTKTAMKFEMGLSSLMGGLDSEELSSLASAFLALSGVSTLKARVISTDTKSYYVVDSLKQYWDMPAEDAADMTDIGDISSAAFSDVKYTGTSNVKTNGVTYICEEFKSKDGEIRRFYFLDGDLKRIEITVDGDTKIIEINSITGTVDDSIFSIPSSYKVQE